MRRRTFLHNAGLTLAGSLLGSGKLRAITPAVTLTMGTTPVATMARDFTGFSFESPQLYNPSYFAASNASLVEAYRKLSGNGVLRAGGHLSDVSRWKGPNGDFSTPKQEAGIARGKTYWEWKLTDPSVRDTRDGAITEESIENLKSFLDATGWRLIYGLNFGCGSIARAVDEASFVFKTMGDRLIAFQLGNEGDQFGGNPVFRARGYNFDAYYPEYLAFVEAIRKAVPGARFGGPDVAGNLSWVERFAEAHDNEASFLSSHYYAMGPAKDPRMNAARLLTSNARLPGQFAQVRKAVAASNGLPFRMTEGNSCFGGGKPGVSDAYASSLWGADYMLQCATAGYAGVNLHGGGDGYYTPIAVGAQLATELRPLYFGMQFAEEFAGAALYECALASGGNATAYFGKSGRESLLAVINKDAMPVEVSLPQSLWTHRKVTATRLSGPSLDATSGIALTTEKVSVKKSLSVAPYAAVLLRWG